MDVQGVNSYMQNFSQIVLVKCAVRVCAVMSSRFMTDDKAKILRRNFFMKRMHKGFTLVELLIVIAILGTLSAAMTTSISGSTAKAKAATIASNVETFKFVAAMDIANNAGENLSEKTAEALMIEHLPTWADFANPDTTDTVIKYTAEGTTGPDSWVITVDFSKDPEKDAIRTALSKIKGYGKYYKDESGTATATALFGTGTDDKDYKFKVTLTTGKIEPVTA